LWGLSVLSVASAASIEKNISDGKDTTTKNEKNDRDKREFSSPGWNELANALKSHEPLSSPSSFKDEFSSSLEFLDTSNLRDKSSSDGGVTVQTASAIYEGPIPSASFTDVDELESQATAQRSIFQRPGIAITRLQPASNFLNLVQQRQRNFGNRFAFQQRRNPRVLFQQQRPTFQQQRPTFQQQLLQQQRRQQQFSNPIGRPVQLQFRLDDDSLEDFRPRFNNPRFNQQRFRQFSSGPFLRLDDDDSRELIIQRNNNFRQPASVQRARLVTRTEISAPRLLPLNNNVISQVSKIYKFN